MKQRIKSVLRRARNTARRVLDAARPGLNRAYLAYLSVGSSRECPNCGWTGHRFLVRDIPQKPAPLQICPRCRSSERHRFAYLALEGELPSSGAHVLHLAPERCIEPWLRGIAGRYLSVDLTAPGAMQKMDITNLQLESNQFSLVWCSHVLEHIEDDAKAMSELFRVLQPSGQAVIMVPIYGDVTYENAEITTPEQRLVHFKQRDHVRLYGLDIVDRLENVGFRVRLISTSMFSDQQRSRYQMDYPSTREIFLCTKGPG